jgi:hypothetical protein
MSNKFAALLLLLSITSAAHAEIYKWVDAKGKVHYSDKRQDAGQAKVDELQAPAKPAAAPAKLTPGWQLQEAEYKKRQAAEAQAQRANSGQSGYKQPEWAKRGNNPETNATRCALARDILSGKARHRGGAPTDANDRQIAQNDIDSFCR